MNKVTNYITICLGTSQIQALNFFMKVGSNNQRIHLNQSIQTHLVKGFEWSKDPILQVSFSLFSNQMRIF